jgi:ribosomal protein S18 acetylase RimI-like enzyme
MIKLKDLIKEMAFADLRQVEKYADKELDPVDVDFANHFFDRVNDPRNGKDISSAELIGFFKRLSKNKKKFLEFIKKYQEFVVKDDKTDINIPFVSQVNKVLAKTIMRKHSFSTTNPVFSVNESYKLSLKDLGDDDYKVIAIDNGKYVGVLQFIKSKFKPVLKASTVSVDPNYQRQGIGSAMYQFAEKEFNMKFVKTDDVLTPDGKALWNNPNRKFGLKESSAHEEALSYTEKQALELAHKNWSTFTGKVCNSGFCDIYASKLSKLLPGSKQWDTEEMGPSGTLGHVWVEFKGKFYDAETPDGVDDWKELPWMQEFYKAKKQYPSDIKQL